MLGHAQRVFSNDEEMKSQFTYASLREKAGAHKVAGVRGNVIDGETNLPLKDVEVSNETKTHNDTTNPNGNFHIKGLGEGKDKLIFKLPGYREVTEDTDLKAGHTITIDIKLFKTS